MIMNMTSMRKRCKRSLRTITLSLPRPSLNHRSFSITSPPPKLGNGSWNGTTEAFIIHWQNQVCLYEKRGPPTDHFSDGQKPIMLQSTVNGIDELRQVKNTADHMRETSGTTLTYDEYATLLLSAASAYDDQFKPKWAKRHVLLHDIQDYYDDHDDEAPFDPNTTFDIDCPVSSIQAYATNFQSKSTPKPNTSKVRMPSEKWFGLDAASKAIWDCLDDKSKSIILGYTNAEPQQARFPTNTSNFQRPPVSQSGKTFFKPQVNLHEISAYDFLLANIHDVAPSGDDPDPDVLVSEYDDPLSSEDTNDMRLIYAEKSSGNDHLPPGDIRRDMSKSSTRRASSTPIEYFVSKDEALLAHSISLIDRGANGGVAGDDVRIIFRTHRTVDIKGIDNHDVNNIGIGTVGGVVQTQHGSVFAPICLAWQRCFHSFP
jgi:hypothetical protein